MKDLRTTENLAILLGVHPELDAVVQVFWNDDGELTVVPSQTGGSACHAHSKTHTELVQSEQSPDRTED